MGNPKAFITIPRKEAGYRPVEERTGDFEEVELTLNQEERKVQASRCMDCGIPFCHWACPLGNRMPEWQDMIYKGKWKEGVEILHETNNFPDFTGRVCPAPCEKSCVLALHEAPVTIRENEASVTEVAFLEGMIKAIPPRHRTGKRVAVVGSGPAGLAIAQQLNRKGHTVTVFEKDRSPGGLLRYGIPNFKLDKKVIDRRLNQLVEEGVLFRTNTEIGKDVSGEELMRNYDAVCLAVGAGKPRDITPVGRDLKGIYFAMDFLSQQNQLVMGEPMSHSERISARGKHVLVIGGGDTGSDCVGTSIRQGAVKVTQIEIMPKPPVGKNPATPWPHSYPNVLKTSSSHEEGCERRWLLNTLEFRGENGNVKEAVVEEISWQKADNGRLTMVGTGNIEVIKADIVFLALGFVHPVHEGLLDELGLEYDVRGNVAVDKESRSSVAKVFATGDAVMGASLVVKAIASGRKVAESVHRMLVEATV
ncbi:MULTISPECIES: glutamate synthase subunit beta [Petrimonas]|jgi:glutamate synthase (NADPH/NADH) small chain|uniref:Glutamate synthase [NADPH] small chain n=1 Tax=Petrimonas mucosa TaxID=1642646 RepID=A0A1G4G9E7_9BACT|nr:MULTISPECIES: glutamate synthase subunit beta [Petrimonas]MDD3560019.1 glutamate synthase subunit beta [Petrimonas mucosa]SCM59186.1 Glutamate synthase [NADPH] small chain [Petrimonas mucosa]SFU30426.1 glutamate synthase (NADPH/NADH) small chain [Porphyromonadaceae bacterium KHP3R9]HHT30436.1 glutamate synthase subunit beta [Petrimonas mucosa]